MKRISCPVSGGVPACIRGTGHINRWFGTAECKPGISRIPSWSEDYALREVTPCITVELQQSFGGKICLRL